MFVPNFIILCQAVPEKSLTEKKVYTHTHTQTSSQKIQSVKKTRIWVFQPDPNKSACTVIETGQKLEILY